MIAELERQAGQIHFRDLTDEAESLRLIYYPRLQVNGNSITNNKPRPLAGLSGSPAPEDGNGKGNNQLSLFQPGSLDDPAGWLLKSSEGEHATALHDALQASHPLEVQRGSTLVGPHRDDFRFLVNGRDLADYGSRGQQRTAVLALKLAEAIWMEAKTGERPVLLLDEVLAELDRTRRALLLDHIGAAEQAILTATDPTMFTASFLAQATQMEVADGRITLDSPSDESE